MEKYSLQLIWSEEQKGYIGTVPELPHIQVVAATAGEGVSRLHAAVDAYLKEMQTSRELLIPPRRLEEYSGQFRLRIPKMLHALLVREAEEEKVSLNTYIMYLLSRRHAQQTALVQAAAYYDAEIRQTLQCMHELVSSVTVSAAKTPEFSWQNHSSETIIQIQ